MSVDGIASSAPQAVAGGGSSPADVLTELYLVLRKARQSHRETEQAFSDAAIRSAEARARHASQRAEATRNQALLQFCINAGQCLSSIVGSVAVGAAEDRERARAINSEVQRHVSSLGDLGCSASETFGFGRRAGELEAGMERDSTQQTRFQSYEDRTRSTGEELDDALSDLRQTLRDINNGQNGG